MWLKKGEYQVRNASGTLLGYFNEEAEAIKSAQISPTRIIWYWDENQRRYKVLPD
jgi:preprotein translocase subunit Sec61beta